MHDWIDVAVIAKARNSKGRFAVRATAGLPFILETGDEVAFVPPQIDVPRRAIVQDVKLVDDANAEVSFEGVDEPETMSALEGMHCLIRRNELDDSVYEDAPGMWDGWMVVDGSAGEIGPIIDVIDNPGQALIEVARSDGKASVLVPVVDEIVVRVDPETCTVHVALPNGLLDL